MLLCLSLRRLSEALVDRIGQGDDILLQHSLVYTARRGHADNPLLLACLAKSCQVYLLSPSLAAYGIAESELIAGVQCIDYAGFVSLAEKNLVIHTWC